MAKRHKKALAQWAFWLIVLALMLSGSLPRIGIMSGTTMQPEMAPLSIFLLDTKTRFEELQEGDIIAFMHELPKQSMNEPTQTQVWAHKIYFIDKQTSQVFTSGNNNIKDRKTEIAIKNGEEVTGTIEEKCQQICVENVEKNQFVGKGVQWWH